EPGAGAAADDRHPPFATLDPDRSRVTGGRSRTRRPTARARSDSWPVDGAAAAAGGLAADRAVAVQERDRGVRLAAEPHLAAVARAFQLHVGLLVFTIHGTPNLSTREP